MSCRPNHMKYDGQCQAQHAHLYIYESGKIDTEWSAEISNSTPARCWLLVDMRFSIDPGLTKLEIDNLIEKIKPFAKELLDKSEVIWKNDWKREFTEASYALYEKIMWICDQEHTEEYESCDDEDCDYCSNEG